MSDLIDYAEKAGFANMQERIDVASMIQREANTLMALLLAGAGTALAFSANENVENIRLLGAAIATSLYLFLIAAVLNWKCLGLIAYPASHNVPKNLNKPEYEIAEVRQWELENLQARIDQALAINETRSRWLNGSRLAATLTPLATAAGWALAGHLAADPDAAALAAVLDYLSKYS